jgi:hypothetical protein
VIVDKCAVTAVRCRHRGSTAGRTWLSPPTLDKETSSLKTFTGASDLSILDLWQPPPYQLTRSVPPVRPWFEYYWTTRTNPLRQKKLTRANSFDGTDFGCNALRTKRVIPSPPPKFPAKLPWDPLHRVVKTPQIKHSLVPTARHDNTHGCHGPC